MVGALRRHAAFIACYTGPNARTSSMKRERGDWWTEYRQLEPDREMAAAARVSRARLLTAASAASAVDVDQMSDFRCADFNNQVSLVVVAVLLQDPEQLAGNTKRGERYTRPCFLCVAVGQKHFWIEQRERSVVLRH